MANSKNITFDQLQAALSRVKSALDGKANTSHGNHVPKTETANNARFLRNDNTWQTITPVNIGAADRSHSHGSYVNQNAFTNIKVGDTTVAADSPTDTLTLTAGANVTLTPDATNDTVTIAAKDTVYTHPTTSGYKHIPSGGSSGQILRWSADGTAAWGSDNNTDTKVTNTLNTTAKAYVTGTTSATTNTGTQVFDTGVYLDTTAGKLVATTFAGALSGNATSATKLQTGRTLTIGNTGKTFNGSGNVSWSLSEIGAAASGHTHASIRGTTGGSWSSATVNTVDDCVFQFAAHVNKSATGIFTTSNNANAIISFNKHTGNYASQLGFNNSGDIFYRSADGSALADGTAWNQIAFTSSSITGNAASATKLQNARNIKIGNTSRSFNGTADITWTLNDIGAAASSHSHSYVPLSNNSSTIIKADADASSTEEYAQLQAGHNYLRVTSSAGGTTTTTQGADKLTFNGNVVYHAGKKPTPAEIGAAAASHGTHVTWSTTTPKANGTAAVGTETKVARGDHVHPLQTTVSGNAGTATKLQTARTLTIGNTGKNFDGSGNVSWSLSEIGAASSGHAHNKIVSRGKVTCETGVSGRPAVDGLSMSEAYNNGYPFAYGNVINLKGQGDGQIFVGWSGSDGGHAPVYVRSKRDNTTTADWSNWAQFYTSANPQTSVSGNAGTATKLQNARNIKIGNTSRSFNGTADVTWTLGDIGAAASNHGHSNMLTFKANHTSDWTSATSMAGKVYMGGWHGNITDSTKDRGYISLALSSSKALDVYLDGDYYANENNLVLNTGNYKSHVTPANIGAANASHGTHVTYGGNGSATTVSRSDHTHSYIPLGGSSSITGNLEFSNSGTTARGVIGTIGDNDFWRIVGGATATNAGYLEIATADDANEPIYVRQYGSGKFGTLTRTATLLDGSGNTSFPGTVTAPTFKGALNGNASSATKLQTARKINDIAFDGTADKTIPLKTFGSYVGNDNAKNYHRILSSGNVTGQYTDKSITLMASSDYDGGAYGILRIILRTNSSTSGSTGKIEWIARKGFALDSIVFNIKSTAGATVMDVFYKSPGTYACVTWTVLGEGGRDGRNGNGGYGSTWTKYNTAATNIEVYTADTMKTIASYTSTMNQGADVAHVNTSAKLNTARSINGTNFDGTANITTANWGTSRTLTVGNTGKSVNGGGNVSWSIDEIGALKASKQGATDVNTLKTTGRYFIKGTPTNAPTSNHGVIDVAWDIGTPYQIFYPDNVNTAYKRTWNSSNSTWSGWTQLKFTDTNTWRGVQNNLTSDATDQSLSAAQGKVLKGLVDGKAASNHTHGLVNLNSEAFSGGNDLNTYNSTKTWVARTLNSTTNKPADYFTVVNFGANSNSNFQLAHSYANNSTLYVRGRHDTSGNYTPWAKIYTDKNKPTASEIGAAAASHTHNYAGSSSAGGNANAAVKLATARSINGTSFDGSGNITTANWGTARTLTIGSTGKSVNGGGNVTWTWNEMGVPKSQGNYRFGGNQNAISTAQFITLITNAGAFNQFYWISRGTWDYAGNQYINDTGCGNIHLAGCTVECIGSSSSYTIRVHTPTTSSSGVTYGDFIYVNNGKDYSPGWRRLYSNKYKPTPADIGAAAKSHGNHVPATQTADNKKFLRNDNTWQTVTPANIGAAAASHTHNQILDSNSNITIAQANDRSGLNGKNNVDIASWYGVSISNGCSNNNNYGQVTFSVDARNGNVWARGTVNAPTFSGSLSGNASSATKLQTARAIKIGNTSRNFDGTGNVTWTLSDIGAAASNHSHSNYAASSHEHNYLNVKGTNTINSTANDTTAKWGAQGNSVHWYTEANKINGQPSQWGYLVNIGQSSEVHQIWMEQANGNLSHRGGNNSGWGGSWKTILDSSNYSTWAAAKSHTHNYAASNHTHNYAAANHTHNYAASNHNHDSAYLKLSGGTLSGSLTVNNNVYSKGFCVSKNNKEAWLDIGDNDTYIWASGANKSLQITHGGDLNFDGKPVLYGGRGNNYDTATNTIYFNNAGASHKGRISCYKDGSNKDYVQTALRTADTTTNYVNIYEDSVKVGSNNICLNGKKLTIATSAPSGPATGDVWINIG